MSDTARHPPHRSWLMRKLGEPIARSVSATIAPREKNAPPTAPASESGPCFSRTPAKPSAIASSAASQEISSQRLEPRSPTRRKGWSRRFSP